MFTGGRVGVDFSVKWLLCLLTLFLLYVQLVVDIPSLLVLNRHHCYITSSQLIISVEQMLEIPDSLGFDIEQCDLFAIQECQDNRFMLYNGVLTTNLHGCIMRRLA